MVIFSRHIIMTFKPRLPTIAFAINTLIKSRLPRGANQDRRVVPRLQIDHELHTVPNQLTNPLGEDVRIAAIAILKQMVSMIFDFRFNTCIQSSAQLCCFSCLQVAQILQGSWNPSKSHYHWYGQIPLPYWCQIWPPDNQGQQRTLWQPQCLQTARSTGNPRVASQKGIMHWYVEVASWNHVLLASNIELWRLSNCGQAVLGQIQPEYK